MKKNLIIVLSVFSTAAFASADYLLKKTYSGGFQIPERARSESCELYNTSRPGEYRVEIKRRFGELSSTYDQLVTVKNLEEQISKAFDEEVVRSPNNLCDAPITLYTARSGEGLEFRLFHSGGCGAEELSRNGAGSANLRAFMDEFCPRTFRHIRPME